VYPLWENNSAILQNSTKQLPYKLGLEVHTFNFSYLGSGGRRIQVGGHPGKNIKTLLKTTTKNQIKSNVLRAWLKW
jgi:hypothetical protein